MNTGTLKRVTANELVDACSLLVERGKLIHTLEAFAIGDGIEEVADDFTFLGSLWDEAHGARAAHEFAMKLVHRSLSAKQTILFDVWFRDATHS